MKDLILKDWSAFSQMRKSGSEEDRLQAARLFLGAVQYFFDGPKLVGREMLKAGVREYTTDADFPAPVRDIIEKYHTGIEEVDVGYEEIFDIKDFTSTTKDGFKIRDVSTGLTFRIVPQGDKVDVFKVSGTDLEVTFDRYGGALAWDITWFDDEQWWTVADAAAEFRAKWFMQKATSYYGLIAAIGAGQNVAWQLPSPATLANTDAYYELSRDINTINFACNAILVSLKAAGMSINANTTFVVLAPTALRARISRAIAVSYATPSLRTPDKVEYAVRPLFTTNLSASTVYYVCVPKKKAKGGNRMDLSIMTDRDILSYSETSAGWGRYGGGIGEVNQFRRCSTT